MKILKININNIHSLKGVQPEINFIQGILGSSGLYAITGQTGSWEIDYTGCCYLSFIW